MPNACWAAQTTFFRSNTMPRIEALTDDQADGQAAELFSAITQKVGKVPNLYRTLGQAPSVLAGLL